MCRLLDELVIKPLKRDLVHQVQAKQWRWSLNNDNDNDGGSDDDDDAVTNVDCVITESCSHGGQERGESVSQWEKRDNHNDGDSVGGDRS